jgi:hypothetical protein
MPTSKMDSLTPLFTRHPAEPVAPTLLPGRFPANLTVHRTLRGRCEHAGKSAAGRTSSFNFITKGGGGLYLQTRSRQAFDIGLHWSHISNANLGAENYEFNGVQLSIAYHWFK